jgi:hypothetical protein
MAHRTTDSAMRSKDLLIAVTIVGGLATSSGCYYDVESELYPNNFCDTSNTAFEETIQPIIQGNCALPGCHVAAGMGTGDFTTYAGFLAQVSNGAVSQAIQHTGNVSPMPPSGKLTDCDIKKILLWVDAGAPNN